MGQSGSGKSTILRLILVTLRPDPVRFFSSSLEITRLSRRKLQRVATAHRYGVSVFSIAEFAQRARQRCVATAELTDKSRSEIDKIVDEKLELVGMGDSKELLPEELSGGMRKRVALARALVLNPELLLWTSPRRSRPSHLPR